MAPIKFEENIKDKLEQRRLEPSQDAWEMLSDRLENNSKKKNNNIFFYIGIAASIVGVLLVYTLLIKTSNEAEGIQEVVDTEIKNESFQAPLQEVTTEQTQIADTSEEEVVPTMEVKENAKEEIFQKSNSEYVVSNAVQSKTESETTPQKSALNQPINELSEAAAVASVTNKPENKQIEKPLNELDYESAKVIEVVAQIEALESRGDKVTDAEIDALLKQAERDILKQRLYNETTRTVNADALLKGVEEDLEESFRARVFQNLKSSFNSVKTAVAARNN